ncbi:MAG: UDP-N-acetylmuramoyl-tripeptide--D-alanyl-D-alanine ligase [Candidatus Liptonbacteria bacterium]|nr:UDP-N-acetylmuramoyl-tripeptide--D-alanyl-D-alanine ligase [Candidatus Liptonbacteria bacterium]
MKSFCINRIARMCASLARAALERYQPGIIGVTGSVGKTSTKNAICHLLRHQRRIRCAKKNFNNELGVSLTVLGDWDEIRGLFFWPRVLIMSFMRRMMGDPKYPELLILEYGADRPGDIKTLISIARPTIACITAIGDVPAHVEFFTGPDAVAREKGKLIESLPATGFAVLNADDEAVMNLRDRTRARVMTFGFAETAEVRMSQFENRSENGVPKGISFKLEHNGSIVPVRIDGAFGLPQAYIAGAATCVGLIFGMNLVKLAEAFGSYTPTNGRMKLVDGIKNTFIVDDSYNASPLSMKRALETIRDLAGPRKVAVLGDMLEIGPYTAEAHEAIGALAAEVANVIVTVGPHAKFIAEGARKVNFAGELKGFDSADDAKRAAQALIREGDIVLVKGSQGMRMERIVEEIMKDPQSAPKLLVRQSKWWKKH